MPLIQVVVLNCPVALDQGRYTWRHNSVLSNLIRLICPKLAPDAHLFSDMPGYLAPGGGSIPPTLFFYKNNVYKNVEAQISKKLRTC